MIFELGRSVVFVDIDVARTPLYSYRSPHMAATRRLGYVPIVIAEISNPHLEFIREDCDILLTVEALRLKDIEEALQTLERTHQIAAIFTYPGQERPGIDVNTSLDTLRAPRGLPAPSALALKNANNKALMRRCLTAAGLPTIRHAIVNSFDDLNQAAMDVGFPLFCKPPFGAASAFSTRCDTQEELHAHYAAFIAGFLSSDCARDNGGSPHMFKGEAGQDIAFLPGRTMLVEEWLEGPEGTVECVATADGRVHAMIIHDKLLVNPVGNTVLERLLVTPPERFDAETQAQIAQYAQACVAAIGLKNSLAHFEFKLTAQGPRAIEINPRLGGFYVDRSWEMIAGIDPYELNIKLHDGTFDPAILPTRQHCVREQTDMYTMFVLYPDEAGKITEVTGLETLQDWPGVLECSVVVPEYPVDPAQSEVCLVKVFAKVPTAKAALELYDRAFAQAQITSVPVLENQI